MKTIVIAFIVVAVVWPIVWRLLLRTVAKTVLRKAVGEPALARQPDTIHLVPASGPLRAEALERSDAFEPLGYGPATSYEIPELAGLRLSMRVARDRRSYAIVYDHPRAGVFSNLVARYADGSSLTISSLASRGLDRRPSDRAENLDGASPSEMHGRLTALVHDSAVLLDDRSAASAFEQAWADDIAWRKGRGIRGEEVARVIRTRDRNR